MQPLFAVAGMDTHRLGLVLATFIGGWHLVWSALVPWRAAALIAVTATLGYLFGRIGGSLWNAVQRS